MNAADIVPRADLGHALKLTSIYQQPQTGWFVVGCDCGLREEYATVAAAIERLTSHVRTMAATK